MMTQAQRISLALIGGISSRCIQRMPRCESIRRMLFCISRLRKICCTLLIIFLLTGASPAISGTFNVFGPQVFQREKGSPVLVSASFNVLNPNVPYTLVVHNGGLQDNTETGELVSSSVIFLNGKQIIGPDDFNQNVTRITEPVVLAAQNELQVEVRGKPGGLIAIEITGVDEEPPALAIISPVNGATLNTSDVTFGVNFSDHISGIDPSSLSILLDGVDATSYFTVDNTSATYTATLADGPHNITASIRDRAGNTSNAISAFTITTAVALVSRPRAIPSSGDAPLTVQFIPEFVTDAAVERFEWDFDGDGIFERSEVIGRNQSYTYTVPGTYNVVLRITDSNGRQASGTVIVRVGNSPPAVFAEAMPSNGQIPLAVTFSVNANDSDGISLYEWDFEGDGTFDYSSPTTGNTSFTYTQVGTYQPVIRVTDTLGASASVTLATTEVRAAVPGSPSVTATASRTSGNAPLSVSFNATATDPDGLVFTEWAWDFDGDGAFDTSGASPSASYTFTAPGTYYPRVRVTASDGGTAEDVVRIFVEASVSLSVTTDTIDPDQGGSTVIRTVLGGDTRVSVVLEDRFGDVVRTLLPWGLRSAGTYDDVWGGENDAGANVPEGDYYAVLLYEIDGQVNRLDLRQTTGGGQYNPTRSRLPTSFAPFDGNPLVINFTLTTASEVTAFMGRFNVNTRLVTFFERKPLGRGTHTIVWNGENGDGQLIHPPPGDRFLFGIFAFRFPNNGIYVKSNANVSGVSASPAIFDPDGELPSSISFTLSKPADVELLVANAEAGGVMARIPYTGLDAGVNIIEWDGRNEQGEFLAPGRYRLGITAVDPVTGSRSITVYTVQRLYY